MRFLYCIIIVVLWTSVSFFRSVFAHPLDVSNTTLTLYPSTIEGVTYLHPVELDRILILSGGIDPARVSVDMYYSHQDVFFRYLNETIQVENEGQSCAIGKFETFSGLLIDEVFRNGFPISYTIECLEPIKNPRVIINICNEVQLQTNRLYIYESIPGSSPRKRGYRVLNAQKNSHILVLDDQVVLIDTDRDGLSDEDEKLYGTKIDDGDTDGDGYPDKEELDKSWDPRSSELSPGQRPIGEYRIAQDELSATGHTLSQDTVTWGGERFGQILTDIRLYVESYGDSNRFFWLLFSVGILGFIHALGPGHSKGILISQILDRHMTWYRGIAYAGIFSLVHILDIVVVVLVSKFLLKVFDPGEHLGTIQGISIFLILGLSVYLFIQGYHHYTAKYTPDPHSSGYIFLAILSGLTPCAFGWSIFLLLFAVKRLDLALPLLLSLGLGIFLCLAGIALITYILKARIYSISPRIGLISPMISSFFLFSIGSYLLIQYL